MGSQIQFKFNLTAISIGIAIFSMFFGAGNVVFPLILGYQAGEHLPFALIGLLLTAIGGPLLGLFGTILFKGDCKQFFQRIGTWPSYLVVLLIMALIGPLGGMPRCFIVSYGAIAPYLGDISLFWFSLLAGAVVMLSIIQRKFILPLLGWFLSPLLVMALIIIIVKGLISFTSPMPVNISAWQAFTQGLGIGFDTMDLLASILFAVVIWDLLKEKLMVQAHDTSLAEIAAICCMASLIGGTLLGLIYVGLSSVATGNMEVLHAVPKEFMLSALAVQVLGEKLAFVANIAIALACLTTVISLAVTIADVIKVEFDASPLGQRCSLHYGGLTLSIVWLTVVMSNLGFDRLMLYLHPVIALFYPAIIVLTICNILYKLYNFKLVKLPFYITLAGTLGYRLL